MATQQITTDVTRRLDVLHWSKFHTVVTAVLGIGWPLDTRGELFEIAILSDSAKSPSCAFPIAPLLAMTNDHC